MKHFEMLINFEEENWEKDLCLFIMKCRNQLNKDLQNPTIQKVGNQLEVIDKVESELMFYMQNNLNPQKQVKPSHFSELKHLKAQNARLLNSTVSRQQFHQQNSSLAELPTHFLSNYILQTLYRFQKFLNPQNQLKLSHFYFQAQKNLKQKQQSKIKLYSLTQFCSVFFDDLARQINLFMLVSWIVTVFLIKKDVSPRIDYPYSDDSATFRQWMKRDAQITFALALIFFLFNITLTKLWNSKPQFGEFERIKNPNRSFLSKILQPAYKIFKVSCLIYEVILTLGVVFILLVKVYWVLRGFYIFFQQIDFQQCSNMVIWFYFFKFMLFFTYATYLIIFKGFKHLQEKQQKSNLPKIEQNLDKSKKNKFQIFEENKYVTQKASDFNSNVSQEQKLLDEMQKQKIIEENQVKWKNSAKWTLQRFLGKKILVYVNFEDFKYLMNKILIWSFAGFVSELIFWRKDKSEGLKATFYFKNLKFVDWMIIDSILGMGIFVMILILIYRFVKSQCPINIWRLEQKGLFFVEIGWVYRYSTSCLFLVGLFIMKIAILIYGVIFFYFQVDFKKCSQTIATVMLAYFVQSIFLLIEGSSIVVNGIRAKGKLLREGDQDSQQQIDNEKKDLGIKKYFRESRNKTENKFSDNIDKEL